MRMTENYEPDMAFITENLKLELRKYPNDSMFITQAISAGMIRRN